MTNEAVKIELTNGTGNPRRFTVSDGAGILKGTILKLTDPRTATASDGAGDVLAGIASMEKVSSDGSTSISCWTDGIFDLIASGSINVGSPVMSTGTLNQVKAATALTASGAQLLGYALETASDTEVINVRVRL